MIIKTPFSAEGGFYLWRNMEKMCTNTELQNQITDLSGVVARNHKYNCDENKKTRKEVRKLVKIIKPLEDLYPTLKQSVELKRSTDNVINSWKGKVKTGAIFLGFIAVMITIFLGIYEALEKVKIIR